MTRLSADLDQAAKLLSTEFLPAGRVVQLWQFSDGRRFVVRDRRGLVAMTWPFPP